MRKTCTAVIVAAGNARRMEGIDKIMHPTGGIPMLLRTVQALSASTCIDDMVIVTREDLIGKVRELCGKEPKVKSVVAGGSSRAESVLKGIYAASGTLVAIHDGARPFVPREVIDEAVAQAARTGAAAPAIPVHDTIKVAKNGLVLSTPDRSSLFAVQTPQVFDRVKIKEALEEALSKNLPLTDDCSAAEYTGMEVVLTRGSEVNIKITVPTDLILEEAILKERRKHENRSRL